MASVDPIWAAKAISNFLTTDIDIKTISFSFLAFAIKPGDYKLVADAINTNTIKIIVTPLPRGSAAQYDSDMNELRIPPDFDTHNWLASDRA